MPPVGANILKIEEEGRSKEVAENLIDLVNRIVNESPDKFSIATSPAEVEDQFEKPWEAVQVHRCNHLRVRFACHCFERDSHVPG